MDPLEVLKVNQKQLSKGRVATLVVSGMWSFSNVM